MLRPNPSPNPDSSASPNRSPNLGHGEVEGRARCPASTQGVMDDGQELGILMA